MKEAPELTIDDLDILISRFTCSIFALEISRDYPEHTRDKKLLRKLTDMKFYLRKYGDGNKVKNNEGGE